MTVAASTNAPSDLGAWMQDRHPSAPSALRQRMMALASPFEGAPRGVAGQCLDAAQQGLGMLLSGDGTGRDSALDLLAIDALVTYGFEACARDPERIPELAADAMARLSSLVPRA